MTTSAARKLLKFWGVKYIQAPETPAEPDQPASVEASAPSRPQLSTGTGTKTQRLAELQKIANGCEKCPLAKQRNHLVFGEGNPDAQIVFVGEAPGFDEDRQGRPFIGRAGQLLTDIITKGMGISRDDVYICNVLKCRPPNNRTPNPEEVVACCPYLFEQLRIIRPKVIIALGAPAAKTLLDTSESISRLRGHWQDFYLDGAASGETPIRLMPTFHPAYLLRNPSAKAVVWDDIKKVMAYLNIPIPEKRR